jgi:hypothetical protein
LRLVIANPFWSEPSRLVLNHFSSDYETHFRPKSCLSAARAAEFTHRNGHARDVENWGAPLWAPDRAFSELKSRNADGIKPSQGHF